MIQPQERIIPFAGDLDQATTELLRGDGTLVEAGNADRSKAGGLRKRRGYRLLDLSTDTHGETPEVLYLTVGTLDGELVLYGRDFVYGVHADTAAVDGASVTQRGPSMPGDVDSYDVIAIGMTE